MSSKIVEKDTSTSITQINTSNLSLPRQKKIENSRFQIFEVLKLTKLIFQEHERCSLEKLFIN
jgi:hypothetical protein